MRTLIVATLSGALATASLTAAHGCAPVPANDCATYHDCPAPDGGEDSPSDVIIAVRDGDSAATPDGGQDTGALCSAPESLDCDGTCVDPTLPAHCGRCDNVCGGPDTGSGQATCTAGVCGVGCSGATSLNCSGACVDPSQPANCGSCTNTCAGPTVGSGSAICTLTADGGGECTVSCAGTTTEACGASCFAPTDPNHCGSCTNACLAPPSGHGQATCTGTTPACGLSCTTGNHVCGADCLANTDEPSDVADPCVLTEAFGIFAAPTGSDAAGTGSRIAPYATIGHAMDQAKAAGLSRVYACGTAGTYAENLVVGSSRTGITVYGGLNCTTTPSAWSYVASDLATVAPTSGYALQITAAVTFEDFGFVAAAATAPGSSSIAVFASDATSVVLQRCDVQAGTGFQGTSPSPATPPAAAPGGGAGTVSSGGSGAQNPTCSTSYGGNGAPPTAGGAAGSTGQPGSFNGNIPTDCSNDKTDDTGANGAPGGAGSGALMWATFNASGWTPTGGTPGTAGTEGQGGGGGANLGAVSFGGGGGGAGGCGSAGGPAGLGGGSSIAALLFDSTVDLESCHLVAANGGPGGAGAAGQNGQAGGPGGTAAGECSGGMGGSGGSGGPGGGGAGGLSAGVVWAGTAPTVTAGSQTTGTAGAAGQNGDGTTTAKAGTAGGVVQFQ